MVFADIDVACHSVSLSLAREVHWSGPRRFFFRFGLSTSDDPILAGSLVFVTGSLIWRKSVRGHPRPPKQTRARGK
jgi:hypothetical protein